MDIYKEVKNGSGSGKSLQVTFGLVLVVAAIIYIYERLKLEQSPDVFLAILVFGGALIYMYSAMK